MHRNPVHRWLPGTHNQAAGGGMEELQTDVMRFLAILSICLVAIFALVQSIPLVPETGPEKSAEAAVPPEPAAPPEPVVREEPAVLEKPAPVPKPAVSRPPPRLPATPPAPPERVARSPVASQGEERRTPPVRQPTPSPPQASSAPVESAPIERPAEPEQEGFTLRFESDTALKALVAKSEVGLYAVTPNKSWRLSLDGGRLAFWPASRPSQFHEMTTNTVPRDVVGAIRNVGVEGAAATLTWGVTLPSKTTRQLNRILGSERGGALVIDARGNLRLETGKRAGGAA